MCPFVCANIFGAGGSGFMANNSCFLGKEGISFLEKPGCFHRQVSRDRAVLCRE